MGDPIRHYLQALHYARDALDEVIDETPTFHDEDTFVRNLQRAAEHAQAGWEVRRAR
jgi:hypothetical protein